MAKRLPKDFNVQAPPLEVTDPDRADAIAMGTASTSREYPKHLARLEEGGGREVVEVDDAADERRRRAQGFKTHHELDADVRKGAGTPKAAKPKAARKPRNPAPKPAAAPIE